jgi:hypothetical protein
MKFTFSSLLLWSAFSLVSTGVFAQFDVSGIDNTTLIIKNNLENFTKSESDITKDEMVVGHREVYLMGKEVALAVLMSMDQDANENKEEYYYSNNQLIYIQKSTAKPQGVFKEKFYFDKGHLQSWINWENKGMDPSSADFKSTEEVLTSNALKIKKEFEN